jgi:molybdopterin-guanine dinucleotide biosynthesis protein A
LNFVEWLAAAVVAEGAEIAMVRVPESAGSEPRAQPVFSLMNVDVVESLSAFLQSGGRKIDEWTATRRTVMVDFQDTGAFRNANTLAELHALSA